MTWIDCDIAIVGGGMVGAALARLLARDNFNTVLIEREVLTGAPDLSVQGLRVSAINPGSERILGAAGVWTDIEGCRVSPYSHMKVWDAHSGGRIEFEASDLGLSHLGSIVENRVILWALHQALVASDARILAGESVSDIKWETDSVTLRLGRDHKVKARLLVAADGGQSGIRKELDIGCRHHRFDQQGIVAQVSTELSHQNTAWQRFLKTGPLAFLPLSNGDSSIVWSCTNVYAEQLLTMSDHDFALALSAAFEHKLGVANSVGPRRAFPIQPALARRFTGPRTALVGDAAHVVHPLAGQGANLGLVDVAALAQVLSESRTKGRDIGSVQVLRRYERWRRGENTMMYHALNCMGRLFGTDRKPINLARGLGLSVTNKLAPVKLGFARQAMGLRGDLPRIMRSRHY